MGKKIYSYILTLLPALGALGIWFYVEPISERFTNYSVTLLSLGRISGLLGMVLFSVSLILNARIKLISKLGVEPAQICKLHHIISLWAFVLMFAHPILLAINVSLYSYYEAAKLLLPKDDLVYLFGFFSLWILVPVVLLSDSLKKYHQLWLWIHRATLVSYALGVAHLLFVTSDTSRHPLLKNYILVWAIVGVVAFVYQRIIYQIKKEEAAECAR